MKRLSAGLSIIISLLLTFKVGMVCHGQEEMPIADEKNQISVKKFIIDEIIIEGNQKTHENIIRRELKFSESLILDSLTLMLAVSESKKNLLRQPLFNYVTIETIVKEENRLIIKIIVEERWYLWPQLGIINNERNFNTWVQSKDLAKLDYRIVLKKYNSFGLNHTASIGFSDGYTKEISVGYQNIFLDRKQNHYIGVVSRISFQKSAFYKTFQNKQESYASEEGNAIWIKNLTLNYDYRPRYNYRHSIILSYNDIEINDSLVKLNPSYLGTNQTKSKYLELRYQFLFDKRDSRSYPLTGYFFEFNLTKTGIGSFYSRSVNLFSTSFNIKQYYNIAGKFYGAHSLSVKKSFENEQPYFFKRGLGYKDFIRGFEYYVIECEDYYLLKNSMKFELLPKTIVNLNFIPSKKFSKIHYAFYLNAFFDVGYTTERNYDILAQNNLSNKILFSTGIGFDIATYYDKVIRLEYSINSLGNPGLFIHFRASI